MSVPILKHENKKLSLKVKLNQYTCSLHQDIREEMEIALLSKTTIKTLHKKKSLCLERESHYLFWSMSFAESYEVNFSAHKKKYPDDNTGDQITSFIRGAPTSKASNCQPLCELCCCNSISIKDVEQRGCTVLYRHPTHGLCQDYTASKHSVQHNWDKINWTNITKLFCRRQKGASIELPPPGPGLSSPSSPKKT